MVLGFAAHILEASGHRQHCSTAVLPHFICNVMSELLTLYSKQSLKHRQTHRVGISGRWSFTQALSPRFLVSQPADRACVVGVPTVRGSRADKLCILLCGPNTPSFNG